MFFIVNTFKGHVHVFAGRVKVVSHLSCRTSTIFKFFCPLCGIYSSAHLTRFYQGSKHYEVMNLFLVPQIRPDFLSGLIWVLTSADDISRLPGKSVIRLTDHIDMTIAVDWDVKLQTK